MKQPITPQRPVSAPPAFSVGEAAYADNEIEMILTQRYKTFDEALGRGLHPAILQLINLKKCGADNETLGDCCRSISGRYGINDRNIGLLIDEKRERRQKIKWVERSNPSLCHHHSGSEIYTPLRHHLTGLDKAMGEGLDKAAQYLFMMRETPFPALGFRERSNYLWHCFDHATIVLGVSNKQLAASIKKAEEQHETARLIGPVAVPAIGFLHSPHGAEADTHESGGEENGFSPVASPNFSSLASPIGSQSPYAKRVKTNGSPRHTLQHG